MERFFWFHCLPENAKYVRYPHFVVWQDNTMGWFRTKWVFRYIILFFAKPFENRKTMVNKWAVRILCLDRMSHAVPRLLNRRDSFGVLLLNRVPVSSSSPSFLIPWPPVSFFLVSLRFPALSQDTGYDSEWSLILCSAFPTDSAFDLPHFVQYMYTCLQQCPVNSFINSLHLSLDKLSMNDASFFLRDP